MNRKNFLLLSLPAFLITLYVVTISHAAGLTPIATVLGGTGISTTTGSVGQVLSIGSLNASSVPTYAFINGGGAVTFLANGAAFVTSSTIDFQQGSNITITTSSAGVYTIAGSAGSGSVTTSSAITANNFPYWFTTAGGLSGSSTISINTSTGDIGIRTASPGTALDITAVANSAGLRVTAPNTADQSFGLTISAGTSVNDYAFAVNNAAGGQIFKIFGNGTATSSAFITGQATTTALTITGIASGNCLHTTTNGVVVGTGSDCGGGSNPTINLITTSTFTLAATSPLTVASSAPSTITYACPTCNTSTSTFPLVAHFKGILAGATTSPAAYIPYSGTITGWNMSCDASTGTSTIDIWKANKTVPTAANAITTSSLPNLNGQQISSSTTLTGWTTSITAGDYIMAQATSTQAGCTDVDMTLIFTKS